MNVWRSLLCISLFLVASSTSAAEPTVKQCISANEEGQDLRRTGKLQQAAGRFSYCSNASCPNVLREDCAARSKETEGATPSIVFVAKDSRGSPIRGVNVRVDGAQVAGGGGATPIRVDPGEHTFELVADGYVPASKRLAVQEGVKGREEVVVFESTTATPTWNAPTQRTVAYVVGGLGIIGLGIGAVFGVLAKSTYDDAISDCGSPSAGVRSCNETGLAAGERADRQAAISTIAFVAGTAFVAGGVVLFMTRPSERGVSVGLSASGIRVGGTW
jgi:hypothetical protein